MTCYDDSPVLMTRAAERQSRQPSLYRSSKAMTAGTGTGTSVYCTLLYPSPKHGQQNLSMTSMACRQHLTNHDATPVVTTAALWVGPMRLTRVNDDDEPELSHSVLDKHLRSLQSLQISSSLFVLFLKKARDTAPDVPPWVLEGLAIVMQ